MSYKLFKSVALCMATAATLLPPLALAQLSDGAFVNIYSARHYPTDEALYADFTKNTGIKINRVDSDDAGILTRLKAEGAASPADVILLVDAARLWRAEVDGLFLPVKSKLLEEAIPDNLRAKRADNGGIPWFGLSTRARVIVYDKFKVQGQAVHSFWLSSLQPQFVWRHDRAHRPAANRNLVEGVGE